MKPEDVIASFQSLSTENEEMKILLEEAKKEVEEKEELEKKLAEIIEANKAGEEANKLLEEKVKKLEKRTNSIFKKYRMTKVKRGKEWDGVIIDDNLLKVLRISLKTKLPMLLKGPSGTGKSTIVRAIAAETGKEVVEYSFNGETTVENLVGLWTLKPDGKGGSKTVWENSFLGDAVMNGKIFLGHEINFSSPDVLGILNGLLEVKNGKMGDLVVQGSNGKIIKPHPDFRFFGTYNPGYLGTKDFSTSLMSRTSGYDVLPLKEEDEARLLQSRYPKLIAEVNFLVRLENLLRNREDFLYDISTRDIDMALQYINLGLDLKEAINVNITNSLQIDLEKEILQETVNELYLKFTKDE